VSSRCWSNTENVDYRGAKDDVITSGSSSLSKRDDKKRIDRFRKSGPVTVVNPALDSLETGLLTVDSKLRF
jgi:hypothetical protein